MSSPPQTAALIVVVGPDPGRSVPFGEGLTIGRAPDNALVIDEPTVSGHHLRLVARPEGYIATDLRSAEGTKVNGARIEQDTWIRDGDILAIGPQVQLRFQAPPLRGQQAASPGLPSSVGDETVILARPQAYPSAPPPAPIPDKRRPRWPLIAAAGGLIAVLAVAALLIHSRTGAKSAAKATAPVAVAATRAASASPAALRSLAFESSGTGIETASPSGCQQGPGTDCKILVAGTATSSELGTGPFFATQSADFTTLGSNGQGGFCIPISVTLRLVGTNSADSVSILVSGTACDVGPHTPTSSRTFTGTFKVVDATGRFQGASGEGSAKGGGNGSSSFNFSASATLTVH